MATNANYAKAMAPMIISRVSDIFEGDTDSRFASWNHDTAKALAMVNARQTGKIDEIRSSNGDCQGFKVVWLKDCTPVGAATCDTAQTGCDITAPETAVVDEQIYNPNCFMTEKFGLNNDLCNSEFQEEEIIAKLMIEKVRQLDIRLNRKLYMFLAANATPNTHPFPLGTVNGTFTEIPANLWTADAIVQLSQEMAITGLQSPVVLDGLNLSLIMALAEFKRFNANEVSGAKIIERYGASIVVDDITDAFEANGRMSTFAFDPQTIAFVNRVPDLNGATVLANPTNGLTQYNIVSPFSGVRYLVEHQVVCTGRKTGSMMMAQSHAFNIHFHGDFIAAPKKCVGVGSIMEFVKVA